MRPLLIAPSILTADFGRLEEAASQGRLGISESIRGRIADLGGTAELTTGSFGTEWEFVVPRTPATP